MHVVFYIRGKLSCVEWFKIMAQSMFFKWQRTNIKTGKIEEILVQGALRPSVLGTWEYIIPEECLAEFLAMMGLTDEKMIGVAPSVKAKARLAVLRTMLGLTKIPKKIFEEAAKIPPSISLKDSWRGLSHLIVPGVSIHLIGIKKDRRDVAFGFEQEML